MPRAYETIYNFLTLLNLTSRYFVGGSLQVNQRKIDDYEEPKEVYKKKSEEPTDDLDEDLVTDNEDNDNHIYNSNRINKEKSKIIESYKKKDHYDTSEE